MVKRATAVFGEPPPTSIMASPGLPLGGGGAYRGAPAFELLYAKPPLSTDWYGRSGLAHQMVARMEPSGGRFWLRPESTTTSTGEGQTSLLYLPIQSPDRPAGGTSLEHQSGGR